MGLLGWLLGAFGSLFGTAIAQFTAFKMILIALFVAILPVVFNNFIYGQIDMFIVKVQAITGPSVILAGNSNLSLTGVAAYVVGLMKIPDAISIILTAIATRFALSVATFFRF